MAAGDFHSTEKQRPVSIAEWEEHAHIGGVDSGPAFKSAKFPPRAIQVDEQGTTTYVGEAIIGTGTSAAAWRIQRISVSGSVTSVAWANGGTWDQVFDNRASLVYS